ncbi:MAG: hypothetical protein CMK09_04770 [Ponticaulis sp.]|nr:hypothetical protein [Ponticaulis sp.]|tara:strand:+ start:12114 stop:15602 length:3489 start_codon:yes stop_codon:yes gene_type:complete
MPVWIIICSVVGYIAILFCLGLWGDRRAKAQRSSHRPLIYSMALAVYCTSWTYYGGVGTAVSSGWDYVAIYLGPAIVFIFFSGAIGRIASVAQRERINSLSDFLSARYGKSRSLAALATMAAVLGILPYIALQLKSVGMSFSALADSHQPQATNRYDTVFAVALALAVFAIVFGTRRSDTTEKNSGLMHILAFESFLKLATLLVVALLAIWGLKDYSGEKLSTAFQSFEFNGYSNRFITTAMLSMAAIICLPRQFHVAIIERNNEAEGRFARWSFPIYLLLTSLVVIPIAGAGVALLDPSISPDLYVMALPLSANEDLLALLVFLGGFSAATGMVIVSSVALSTMITNDLIVPLFLKSGSRVNLGGISGGRLLLVRRLAIFAILLLAYGYYRIADNSAALAQIGLLSFAAASQFAPALIGAIFWREGHRNGALFGLACGTILWTYCLFLPALLPNAALFEALPGYLNPQALFGMSFGDTLTHGTIWSLGVNLTVYVIVSLASKERLRDRIQSSVFVDQGPVRPTHGIVHDSHTAGASPYGLKALASRFLNSEAVEHAFERFHAETGHKIHGDSPAHWELVQLTEKLLASALGASSARVVMTSAIGGQDVSFGDMLAILDQGTQADRFERHMLQSMLENISQGISVVDQDQRLVAWNAAYVELFNYPPELVRLGVPIEELIEHNIRTGWIQEKDPSDASSRRIEFMKTGRPHFYERINPDGRYLRIEGNPMPGGGYVTTFTDITIDKRREKELLEANETLEERVIARTKELQALTDDLRAAKLDAEGANASKTRFLAAASHDLLQPLNAARLFVGAATSRAEKAEDPTLNTALNRADRAIQSADDLLKGLLDISRLDHGGIKVNAKAIKLAPLLEDLIDEAMPMAAQNNIEIKVVPSRHSVTADPDFLQAILRNFISNARRYTEKGGVLVGVRHRGPGHVAVQVWDTGRGIAPDRLPYVFEEFSRFEETDTLGVRGAGLGLSVVRRLADLMCAKINVRSVLGKGSMFEVVLPLAEDQAMPERTVRRVNVSTGVSELSLHVLCVDDEPIILNGMRALLESWGCRVTTLSDADELSDILEDASIEVVIADLELSSTLNGFEVIEACRDILKVSENVALLTANSEENIAQRAQGLDIRVMKKPVSTDELKLFLSACEKRSHAQFAE